MAIRIHCPHCNEHLETMQQQCPHCRQDLPPGVLYALGMALGETPMAPAFAPPRQPPHHLRPPPPTPSPTSPPAQASPTPVQSSGLRPWLAAALSLLCGLGQLYNGQIVKGMLLIILGTAVLLSVRLPIGKILLPLLWGYAIIDAYVVARRQQHTEVPH